MPTANSNGRSRVNSENHGNANGSSNGNSHANSAKDDAHDGGAPAGYGLGALIVEAQAVRDYLHEGCARASRLCAALKRQHKQSKLVSSALATIRQMPLIEG